MNSTFFILGTFLISEDKRLSTMTIFSGFRLKILNTKLLPTKPDPPITKTLLFSIYNIIIFFFDFFIKLLYFINI